MYTAVATLMLISCSRSSSSRITGSSTDGVVSCRILRLVPDYIHCSGNGEKLDKSLEKQQQQQTKQNQLETVI